MSDRKGNGTYESPYFDPDEPDTRPGGGYDDSGHDERISRSRERVWVPGGDWSDGYYEWRYED